MTACVCDRSYRQLLKGILRLKVPVSSFAAHLSLSLIGAYMEIWMTFSVRRVGRVSIFFLATHLAKLFYVELKLFSYWPRAVNFRNQRPWHCRIMSRTLKVTGNHVKITHFVWFAVTELKKQKHDFRFLCFRSVFYKTIPRPWLFWISQKPHPIIV